MVQRLGANLGTLLLAFILAILVWVVAVNEENPVESRTLDGVPIELVGKPDDMMIIGSVVSSAQVNLTAPRLTLARLTERQVRVVADVSELGPGTHPVPLEVATADESIRSVNVEPGEITITLERSATSELPVEVILLGEPAAGYETETPQLSVESVAVSGPSSAVERVASILARLSIEGLRGDFRGPINFIPVDEAGVPVAGVDLAPESAQVTVPIIQREGYRDVSVTLVITGQVAAGYRVTNLTVSPNFITVASSDPRLVEQMPGFVNTVPLDISEANDDVVRRLPLELPPGVTVDGEQAVLAQVNIAAIEYSLTVERVLEMRGLPPGLSATTSPETVNVLLLGPLTALDDLSLEDVRVVVDLEGLGPGTYQVTPEVEVLPEGLRAENVLPSQVEVIVVLGTPTPSPTVELTPTLTPTATPSPRPTLPRWTSTPTVTLTPDQTDTPSP
jgi:YbbR domain-containing protein